MKKKIIKYLAFFCLFFSKNVYGISNEFKYVIDTIGVPQYNVYGQEINEDVYYTYNVFCYSSPKEASQSASQGFAEVVGGRWTRDDTKYTGSSSSGEYYFLGREYNGSLVSNVYYPVSFFPDTTPEYWNYQVVNGALASWNDSSKYKYVEQLDYMKNANILYDTLNFDKRTTNPYNLVEYNISPSQIGLDKIMLDTCSTWKTNGIMNVVRRDANSTIRYAIFATEPMAASACVKSSLVVGGTYTISENENSKVVPIQFGASAINLTDFAKPKHIKSIRSSLYINGTLVATVESSKVKDITKSYALVLSRENVNSYPLYIEVKSEMYTEFSVDGLMQDGLSKSVNVVIERYKNKLEDAELKELNKEDGKWYVKSLIKTPVTNSAGSIGMIECLKHLCLKVKTDYDTSDISVMLGNKEIATTEIFCKDKTHYLELSVPDNIITVQSWSYLRNKLGNYFLVNQSDVGKRVESPNVLKITVKGKEKCIDFDTIDNYNQNMNYTMYNVSNKEEVNKKIEIKDW
ncbi:MAG: hypothetical protein IJ809_04485 [Clostridia bacterium]|nr:hypothetical protein [Clostridia bacterium]